MIQSLKNTELGDHFQHQESIILVDVVERAKRIWWLEVDVPYVADGHTMTLPW